MTPGERRLAQRLEQKLEDDYLLWYDVAIGPARSHPDFVILHPRRGLLILEVKDWKQETIQSISKQEAVLLTSHGLKRELNPLEQARQYAHAVLNVLERDPQLTFSSGKFLGRLLFPWSHGVVLTNITRRQFDNGGLDAVLGPGRVICSDEMAEATDAEAFQQRLWEMFPIKFHSALSLPQIDRIRWHLFPEVRLPATQGGLFDAQAGEPPDIPDLLRVMDLQQEQLARSLGEGHRVIHGVAGSGKTMILGYRAQQLAQIFQKPILVLCYNATLATHLRQTMQEKGIADRVLVRHFHQWCRAQLATFHVGLPLPNNDKNAFFAEMVERVSRAVENNQIPAAQYDAVLIDEGHDFKPEWFKLVLQMIDPRTNSLLVLYDDAQSIYERDHKRMFSFKSVGIQAQGRTTVLRINYRNTQEVLELAARFARELLTAEEADEDGVPLISPMSAGRHGPEPLIVKLPTLEDEAQYIVDRLREAHKTGTPWQDMAVIYRHYEPVGKKVLSALRSSKIPVTYFEDATFGRNEDTVKFITMHSCKGLEFPLVAIPGVNLQAGAAMEREEARLLYVAMTRATGELMLSNSPN